MPMYGNVRRKRGMKENAPAPLGSLSGGLNARGSARGLDLPASGIQLGAAQSPVKSTAPQSGGTTVVGSTLGDSSDPRFVDSRYVANVANLQLDLERAKTKRDRELLSARQQYGRGERALGRNRMRSMDSMFGGGS
jgi:hypothetical protein